MPVRRMSESFESLPNQWSTERDTHLKPMDTKCHSLAANQCNAGDDESLTYKSALNESVVDDLVSTLTTKLCLKTNHRLCRMSRLSPYHHHNSSAYRSQPNGSCVGVNCKYFVDTKCKPQSQTQLKRSSSMSDTYELMQQLLKEGSLIKEAVKRLQFETHDKVDHKKSHHLYDESSDHHFDQNENQFNLLNSS